MPVRLAGGGAGRVPRRRCVFSVDRLSAALRAAGASLAPRADKDRGRGRGYFPLEADDLDHADGVIFLRTVL
jgi:hypothetical protein